MSTTTTRFIKCNLAGERSFTELALDDQIYDFAGVTLAAIGMMFKLHSYHFNAHPVIAESVTQKPPLIVALKLRKL